MDGKMMVEFKAVAVVTLLVVWQLIKSPRSREDEKVGHIIINNIIVFFMAESGSGEVDNGSFQNQNLQESTSGRQKRCRKSSSSIWAPLKLKNAPRGNPKAAATTSQQDKAKASSISRCHSGGRKE